MRIKRCREQYPLRDHGTAPEKEDEADDELDNAGTESLSAPGRLRKHPVVQSPPADEDIYPPVPEQRHDQPIVAVEERFNYFPTEAEIVVHEFWS